MKRIIKTIIIGMLISITGLSHARIQNGVIQSIQVVNLLANNNLPEVGMTATTIMVKYYNGRSYPCWISTLNYQQDITVHAGPNLGCVEKIHTVEIMPLLVAERLRTYQGPVTLDIDTSKYANQITIVQAKAPLFDPNNGLVTSRGILEAKVQTTAMEDYLLPS